MKDKKLKGKIINSLRRLTYTFKPRSDKKNSLKVDKALFRCEKCSVLCYEGSSEENYGQYVINYINDKVIREKIQMDHIDPVIPPKKGWVWSWDEYIDRLFVDIDGWQGICKTCHDNKTNDEKKLRKL